MLPALTLGGALAAILTRMVRTAMLEELSQDYVRTARAKGLSEETVVCIIEAMKVMNEIKAETKGVITEVVAENGRPVQFGQVLFRVR